MAKKGSNQKMSNEKIAQLLQDVHNFGVNYHTREIFLTSHNVDTLDSEPGVDYRSAASFLKNLKFLETISDDPITVQMQITGGSWESCMAMYDAMRVSKCDITLYAYAQASSASGVLMQGADTRVMMPNTHFMIHYGTSSFESSWIAASSFISYNNLECRKMIDIFAQRAVVGPFFKSKNWSIEKIIDYIDEELKRRHDWFLSAEEAVEMGFADEVHKGE